MVAEKGAEHDCDTPPGAVADEGERQRVVALGDDRAAVRADLYRLRDAGGGQDGGTRDLSAEPANEVLGEQNQLLIERDPGLVARGQVAAGEDALALLDPGLHCLAPFGEDAAPAGRPVNRGQVRRRDQGGPVLRAVVAPPLLAGEQAHLVGAVAELGALTLGDEAVLADLLPAQACLLAQSLSNLRCVGFGQDVVALLVELGEVLGLFKLG